MCTSISKLRREFIWSINSSCCCRYRRITFDDRDLEEVKLPHGDSIIIPMDIAKYAVQKVLVDNGSLVNIIFLNMLHWMDLNVAAISSVDTPLMGFGGWRQMIIKYMVVDVPFAYNVILGCLNLKQF
ncbi:hypothetical protein Salat_1170500 [Sesamum alatum]|uniref:Uncharacterized protein n=1 Tax=Sesamum alatum TaxID=300844 RepID=A0AAE1YEQ2_9LAMI|nr:hypothetical protein Salat_1170500 [Sesamum alatum]